MVSSLVRNCGPVCASTSVQFAAELRIPRTDGGAVRHPLPRRRRRLLLLSAVPARQGPGRRANQAQLGRAVPAWTAHYQPRPMRLQRTPHNGGHARAAGSPRVAIWNAEKSTERDEAVWPRCAVLVERALVQRPHPQQMFRSCLVALAGQSTTSIGSPSALNATASSKSSAPAQGGYL